MSKAVDKISESESEIMKVVWEQEAPVTYTHMRKILTERFGWESPTINTLVNRLVKKGILTQNKKEVYYYEATVSEAEYMQAKTSSFLKKVYNGNVKGLLAALVTSEAVTQEELEELQKYWKEGKKVDG